MVCDDVLGRCYMETFFLFFTVETSRLYNTVQVLGRNQKPCTAFLKNYVIRQVYD